MLLKAGAEAAATDADGECALHKVRLWFLANFFFPMTKPPRSFFTQ